jgi:cell wall-associated NlpC family hydrolase
MPLSPARPRAVRSVLLVVATACAVAVSGLSTAPAVADRPASSTARHGDHRAGGSGEHHAKAHRSERQHRAKHARRSARVVAIRALRVAAAQQGDPYRYGAAGPNAFDCSGLTSYSFRRAGVTIPRTSSAQRGATRRIPARAARPGDLVFFQHGGRVYHVGFYAGQHRVLHSPYAGTKVRKERIWTSSVTYGRIR